LPLADDKLGQVNSDRPKKALEGKEEDGPPVSLKFFSRTRSPRPSASMTPLPPLQPNPLHDHESVLWMVVWAVVNRVRPGHLSPLRLQKQSDYAGKLFPSINIQNFRRSFIEYDDLSVQLKDILDPCFSEVTQAIRNYVVYLRSAFMKAEEQLTGNPPSINSVAWSSRVVSQFSGCLNAMIKAVGKESMEMIEFEEIGYNMFSKSI
jgi:hypothetical protein